MTSEIEEEHFWDGPEDETTNRAENNSGAEEHADETAAETPEEEGDDADGEGDDVDAEEDAENGVRLNKFRRRPAADFAVKTFAGSVTFRGCFLPMLRSNWNRKTTKR